MGAHDAGNDKPFLFNLLVTSQASPGIRIACPTATFVVVPSSIPEQAAHAPAEVEFFSYVTVPQELLLGP